MLHSFGACKSQSLFCKSKEIHELGDSNLEQTPERRGRRLH